MDPLSRDENYPRQLTPEMWREIKSAPPEVIAEMQDDLKHGNTYYTGVETGKGVLLFGRDYVGNRQYGDFMATNIEKRFFEPDFEEKYLNVYELRGWPSLMEGKVNRCCDDYGCLLPLEKIPADAFVDKSDWMTLLYIMDKGYPRDGLIDEYPDNFSFYDKFEKIENKLLGRNRWDVYDVMQEKAKKLAGKLLKEHFSEIRRKTDVKEKEHVKKNKGIKI